MSYIVGNKPILKPTRNPKLDPYYLVWPIEGDIAPIGGNYTTGPTQNDPGEYTGEPAQNTDEVSLLQQIENEWRQWWKEYYGTEYVPGTDPVYGRVFLDHMKPLEIVEPAVLSRVLNVLKGRADIDREIGQSNFITFGSLFFQFVGEGDSTEIASQKAIRMVKGDPVLYQPYVTGNPAEPEEKGNSNWLLIGGVAILLLISGKRKRKK